MPKLTRPNAEQDPDPIDIGIGLKIRARRKAVGMNQPALGEFLGVSYQQVQKYELGVNRISSANLVRIAQALQCSIADLAEPVETTASPQPSGMLGEKGAAELLSAYSAIPDARLKKLVLDMARALATK